MKKIFPFILLFININFLAQAQSEKTATPSSNPNAPEITFENEMHDFGTIDYAGDGVYAFKFTNTGKEPLVVTDAKGSCGCTVPKWPKEPINKGGSAVINVSYDTKRPGPFTKTVTINSNAKTAVKTLTIKGTVMTQEETESQTPIKRSTGMSPLENSNSK